ncbi:MAG TPA: glutamate 5-kinase [Verrucomicrobiota bacterium]|nr:glutamate 5-kinase [Verrucomicrobiota bacterium]
MRSALANVRRLVVKLGTGILTDATMRPDLVQFAQLVGQVAAQRAAGREVVLVSSGAVGAGMGALGFTRRPKKLDELQACAAVGQSRLMAIYETFFRHHGLGVAQVLLTHDDLANHERHLNARHTLRRLLGLGIVPVINENDAVSVTELKFGDNDRLSALVAALLPAELLVILTTAEGLYENFSRPDQRRLAEVPRIDERIETLARGTTAVTATGGMVTKIAAARIAVRSGLPVVIAPGRRFDVLARILAGEEEGTLFVPGSARLAGRKRWLAFFQRPAGALTVDDGARRALVGQGRSLLAPGVVRVEGGFRAGDLVGIRDAAGREIARGLARLDAGALAHGARPKGEAVHRDDLVLL